jgi:type I restriction enzyme, R subunit
MEDNRIHESVVEESIISLLQDQGYEFVDTATGSSSYWLVNRQLDEFLNEELLRECLQRINPKLPSDDLEEAINVIKRIDQPSLFERNDVFHKYLVGGITIEDQRLPINPLVKIVDFDHVENNVFQVFHQVEYKEGRNTRIPDVVIYINGIPMIVMELKSFMEDATMATLENAYDQLGGCSEHDGYRYDIPTLFNYNAFLVISDGVTTKVGTLTSKLDRFNEWKSANGEKGYDDSCTNKLQIMIQGLFSRERLLDVIKNNLFFIKDKNDKPVKILAQYHQYFGVLKSMKSIMKSMKPNGNGKAGIIWHTQGSGKSFSMVMLAHRLLTSQELNVPTIVLLTDRIDLDDQLYKTFYSAREYLRTEPMMAESREDLVKNKLGPIKQGGIIFTTIGKFDKDNLPKNERNNIIVMTDEAHRSHYGIYETVRYEKNKETDEMEAVFKYGVEKYIREALPNATFIGFTGTPISTKDKQTTDIFGDIIDVYDMTQSVIDGSTVKLYYESRIAKVWTDESVLNKIDSYYEDLENNEKADPKAIEKSKSDMASLKVLLESPAVINLLANDIIKHYEGRKGFLNGKAMIVCSTRKAAMLLYKKIIELKPEYKNYTIVVVTESNKDDQEMRDLFGDSEHRKELGEEFKKDTSKYKIAIVVDMWLTGFDVPDLDVMYFIKRLKSYALMQAIARVNRVYPGKEYGLVVDYIGLGKALEQAMEEYTDRDRKQNVQDVKKEIYNILKEKLSILNEWFYKIDKSKFYSKNSLERFQAIQAGAQFILENKEREDSFMKDISLAIKQAFVVCGGIVTEEEKNDIYYYLAIRSYILKLRVKGEAIGVKDMDEYVRNLLADAIKGDEVKVLTTGDDSVNDVINLLSPENIERLRKQNPPLVFVEIVKKLLERAIAESRKNNYLKSQEYSKRLRKILEEYNDRDEAFVADETIVKLVDFAGEMVNDDKQAKQLGIYGRERAFYDALVKDKSAKELLEDETLKLIARELKDIVDEYASTDWSRKKATQARMRIKIKECLKKYNYPPEYRDDAINDVIKQATYMMEN